LGELGYFRAYDGNQARESAELATRCQFG